MPNNVINGIKKINENVLSHGRGIIITEQNKDQYFWSDIPVGSKMINTKDGTEYVKLEGESDWVPSKIKNDGTLSIAKDSIVKTEVFTIKNLDEGNGKFCYTNSKGQDRHFEFSEERGYLFELEEGSYQQFRNHLDVLLDDCLLRNAATGGVEEVNSRRFFVKDKLVVGEEVTARYINTIRLGNPYPRTFESVDTPPEQDAEIGDIWIQYNYTLQDADRYKDESGMIDWNIIKNTPTTIAGYGITNKISYEGHKHQRIDITDFPIYIETSGTSNKTKALLNSIRLSLSGAVTGSTVTDLSNNTNIPIEINKTVLKTAIKEVLADTDLLTAIRSKMQVIGAIHGRTSGTVGTMLPVPNGFTRQQCIFVVEGGSGITLDSQGKISTSVAQDSPVAYLVIGIK